MFFKQLNKKIKSELENRDHRKKMEIFDERVAGIRRTNVMTSIANILSIKMAYPTESGGVSSENMNKFINTKDYKKNYKKKLHIPNRYDGKIDCFDGKLITSITILSGNIEISLYETNYDSLWPYIIQIHRDENTVFECFAGEKRWSGEERWLERNFNNLQTGSIFYAESKDWISYVIKFNKRLKRDITRVLKEEDEKVKRRAQDAIIKKNKL